MSQSAITINKNTISKPTNNSCCKFDCVIFPGQGAQRLTMGKDFFETFVAAQQVIETAKDFLPFDPYHIIQFDEEKLNNTEYTQPCLLVTEIAMYKALQTHYHLKPDYFAGHSLGEYAALVAANVLPFDIALKIVYKRGQLMQNAMPEGNGSMAAIIMDQLPYDEILIIANNYNVDIANYNSPQQIVLSGQNDDLKIVISELEQQYSKNSMRVVYLNVSAAFHSRYMQKIENQFHHYLLQFTDQFDLTNLSNVLSNYTGTFYDNNLEDLIQSLTKQLSSTVKWCDNMVVLAEHAKNILELGPGRPLRGFFQAIGVSVESIINLRSIEKITMTGLTQNQTISSD